MKKVISYINPQKLMAVFIDGGGGGEVLFSYAFLSIDSLSMSKDKGRSISHGVELCWL